MDNAELELGFYDSETGSELDDSLKHKDEARIAEICEQGEALQQLKNCKGYKLLQDFLTQNIQYYQNELLNSRELSNVMRCQEIIKSCQMIPNWIDSSIEQAQLCKEDLKLSK